MTDSDRRRAYEVAGHIVKERMRREASADADAVAAIEASDILVVPGAYDHVEQVLEALSLPFTIVHAEQLPATDLQPHQLLVVNCPGALDPRALRRVAAFVHAGGSLFTTDWALKHVLEPAFPGVVAYNEQPTPDAVVRVEISDHDNPFLTGVMDGADDPQWWLEGSSYPIRILDRARVKVLLRSRELGERWGESPVAITFPWGEGEVFHMISHYYLQRTELRTARHTGTAFDYGAEKGVDMAAVAPMAGDLKLGDVESAASSARMFVNVAAAKKRALLEREREKKASAGRRAGPDLSEPSDTTEGTKEDA
jgi:hypothetical protein